MKRIITYGTFDLLHYGHIDQNVCIGRDDLTNASGDSRISVCALVQEV